MIKEAITALQESHATTAVRDAVTAALASQAAVVHLPETFRQHDLEQYLPNRRRQIGTMKTDALDDFAVFSKAHKSEGATVFVNADNLKATTVLNLGTPSLPGHADNKVELSMVATAAYAALTSITAAPQVQQAAAEFLEDWQDIIVCLADGGELLNTAHAIEAVRNITIEAAKKLSTKVGDFEEESSSLDSIRANSEKKLPTRIRFKTVPFKGLRERTFELRIGIKTGGHAPLLVLRVIKLEDHKQAMAEELADTLRGKFTGTDVPVLIGTYTKS